MAEQEVVEHYLADKIRDPAVVTKKYVANDEVEDSLQRWKKATGFVRTRIDRQCLEPRELVLFVGAVLRLTYNKNVGTVRFSQGQLCRVLEIPDDVTDVEAKVTVEVIPPGVRDLTRRHAEAWPRICVSRHASPDAIVGAGLMKGQRIQFPFRYYKANTIHRVMGETCPMVATEVNNSDSGKKYLRLWERSQLLVLLSRVPRLAALHFVGAQTTTENTFREMLCSKDMWSSFIGPRLELLAGEYAFKHYEANKEYPYKFCSMQVPEYLGGVVYILVSTKNPEVSYVGQTARWLITRLREHNRGKGSAFTSKTQWMPWAPLAYIHGFPANKTYEELRRLRLRVEGDIHRGIRHNVLPERVLQVARDAAEANSEVFNDTRLVLERLGRLSRQTGRGTVTFEDDELLRHPPMD